ncbi:DeoR/GlpR family DNA-binding transcription regulator [Haliea sp. E17]|uniref:DeoR/GlpR family DNA-binding transcription regulator n=1 Tax=Haliea sp. E17 TaxID=3401576 RepID=UPI003AAE52CF
MILEILEEQQFASVKSLTEQLHSSEATIRRDISKLAELQQLRRIRGGAEVLESGDREAQRPSLNSSAFLLDREKHTATKRAIAERAVSLCEEGDSIIINGGSSTYMMGEFLNRRHLKILTNSFVLAQELVANSHNQVTLPGGEIYPRQGIVLSAFDNDTIQYYHAGKMFMGTPGIGEFGVMESDPLLIRSEQKLQRQSDELVILADSSKLGRRSNLIFTPLENVDVLITDSRAPEKMIALLEGAGIEVLIVEYVESD